MPTHQNKQYEELLRANRPMLWRICCGYLQDEHDRQDLFQEICINIWKNLYSFRGEAAISTWMYRIAVNTALVFVRSEQKRQTTLTGYQDVPAEGTDTATQERQLAALYQCIHALPRVERIIITMVLEKVSYREIAETLGMSVSNTGVKINRIKKKLSIMIEETYEAQ